MKQGLLLNLAANALLLFVFTIYAAQGGQGIGVCYGMQGNNLPSPLEVIALCKSRNIDKIRLFGPNPDVLVALKNSGISVILGANEGELQQLAGNPDSAAGWVRANILPYVGTVNFRYIIMGNEEIPGNAANYILPAIHNVVGALQTAGISIPVTTAVSTNVIGTSYPPSAGAFSDKALQVLGPIISFLASRKTPLMVNVYPYFAYATNQDMRLDYALFTAGSVLVQDGNLGYWNLFDAMVDSVKSALEKVGGAVVDVVVSESGWPSAGGANGATVDNTKIYINNLVKHVNSRVGTPKFPGKEIEVYLFALFNENMKPEGTERNFGLFNPDKTEVYHVDF